VSSFCTIPQKLKEISLRLAEEGKTPLYFSCDGKAVGIIAVADSLKPDSAQAIQELENMSVKVVMLTGDNERTAKAIAEKVGIKEVIAGVLPIDKENTVREFMKQGKVAMVGDGINDSPALTAADVGIAIGAGTDIAIEAADIVLINSKLTDVSAAIKLGRATLRNIKQNLFWAFIYNVIGIPLAAGVFIPLFNITLSPMIGAAAMSMSSFCVVTNALRLNLAKIRNTENYEEKEIVVKEKIIMEKTVKIEGMMCPHCEARVKSCFEAMEEVNSALVSHVSGTAVLTLNADLSDEKIVSIIEAQGYKVVG
jgi:Cu2+-exporting ATPase